jgi:predicted Zn-dependent peptidase
MSAHKIYTLENGIRVAHHQVTTTKIVHCGIMLDVGSRDETPANQGIAHFWEHMAFKGTRKRKAFHILNRLESLGGELNAFTDKEKILFFASIRDEYFERAVDLLADITFNSIFPRDQIERERHVILEEMAMYEDNPEDSLQDEFDKIIFSGHPLGTNILGTKKTVESVRRKDFTDFVKASMDTSRIIFSCVGNVSKDEIIRLATKYMGHVPKMRSAKQRRKFNHYLPKTATLHRDIKQARCAIGNTAYKVSDRKSIPFYMLTNILGGSGMNSRLNLALREKYGFVYSIAAQYISFTDAGLFVISFGTEPSQLDRSIDLVKAELKKLKTEPLGKKQLASAKEQIKGQFAMAEENNVGYMIMQARNLLDLGRVPSIDEMFSRIKETTAGDLIELADEIFNEKHLSYLLMKPSQDHGIS